MVVGNDMCSITLSSIFCSEPIASGSHVMANIVILLMIFHSTPKVRTNIFANDTTIYSLGLFRDILNKLLVFVSSTMPWYMSKRLVL